MKFINYNIFFVFCFLLSFGTLKAQNNYQTTFLQGQDLFDKADYQKAQITFANLAGQTKNSTDTLAHHQAQLAYMRTCLSLNQLSAFSKSYQQGKLYTEYNTKNSKKNSKKLNQYADELDNLQAEMYLKTNQLSDAKDLLGKIYENQKNNDTPLKATILANLGTCEWLDSNNSQANDYLQSALTLKKKLFAPQTAEIAAAYNDLGLVATSPEIALENYQKAAQIYQKIYPPNHPKNAIALTNEAIVLRAKKDYVKALANLRNAESIWDANQPSKSVFQSPNKAFVLSLIGQIHADEGKLALAQENQQATLKIYQDNYGQKHPEITSTYNIIGTLFERQGNYKSALQSYQSAILANTKTFSSRDISKNPPTNDAYKPQLLLNSIFLKAEALETRFSSKTLKISDLDKSIECFEICDTLIQKVRQNSVNQQDKLQISALADQIYESAIAVCMQANEGAFSKKNYKEKAFYFSEKSKASALLEAIAETKAKSFAGIPADVLVKEEDLKANITFYEQQVATSSSASNKEQDFETLLRNAKASYLVFIREMEKDYPKYYQLKYGTNSTSIEKIREKINTNTMLVSYFWAKKRARIYVFYLDKTDLSVENVLQQPDFEDITVVLNNSIKFYAKNTFISASNALYKQLFPKKVPEKYTELLIIADSKMPTIPFEALLLQKDKKTALYKNMSFMLKKYAISYSYSASLLTENNNNINNSTQKSILLVAPVKFESFGLNDLPGTATEIEKIAQTFKAKNGKVTILQESQASEMNLKKQDLMSYSYIHFATHGVVDAVNPELSQIYLSNVDADKQNDNHLLVGEIYNLKLNAKLVGMSACETGLGKMSDGEGIIGLSRALLYAGAQSVNVSLWKVSDTSTSDLMGNLFENIVKNNKNHTSALQQAKISLLNSEKFSAPYFWAAFILIGSPTAPNPRGNNTEYN